MAESEPTNDEWDEVSYVISSDYRIKVLDALQEKPGTPSALSERTGLTVAHVSRALGELREYGLVKLLVSEDRKKGRIYGSTDDGEHINELAESQV